jgi:hypothetical protein
MQFRPVGAKELPKNGGNGRSQPLAGTGLLSSFAEIPYLLCLRIASSSSSSDRGEMPST